jgi:hypothetical protein
VKAPGVPAGGLDPTDPGTPGNITTLPTSCCCCCCWYCRRSPGDIFDSQLSKLLPPLVPPGATVEGAWPGKLLPGACLGGRFKFKPEFEFEFDPGFNKLPKPDSI